MEVKGKGLLVGLILAVCAAGCFFQRSGEGDFRGSKKILRQATEAHRWRLVVNDPMGGISFFDAQRETLVEIYPRPADASRLYFRGNASWNPQGTKLTFTEANNLEECALVVFDLSSRRREVLLTMPYLDEAKWSPVEDRIAFVGKPAKQNTSKSLFLLRLGDRNPILITKHRAVSFAWAPDGKWLVLQDEEKNLVILGLDGKHLRRVGNGMGPSWSPDGRYVVFQEKDGNYAIREVENSKTKALKIAGEIGSSLVWSPNGRYLAYSKPTPEHGPPSVDAYYGDLFVLDLMTGVEVRLYRHGGSIYPSDWKAEK
jgi:Tol biopolymer transport system component